MHEPWDWTEQDLRKLIEDQVGESLKLDYKESGALRRTDSSKKELSKDVSAFANAAGGVLVYGMREGGNMPIELDDGLDPDEISKEWVEQVINSRIDRRIAGIRVRQVPLSGARLGRVAYVVYVPSSAHAPHMASDHRYYKRFNFESVPMDEYEVRDVSRRFIAPELHLGLLSRNDEATNFHTLSAYVENSSRAPADFALITYHASGLAQKLTGWEGDTATNIVVYGDARLDVISGKLEWRGSLRLPLMLGTRCRVFEMRIHNDIVGNGHIFWEIFAPGAEAKRGAYLLSLEGGSLTIAPSEIHWGLADQPVWRI